ncbi:rhodanese-like domain-containing protein [Paenibacillus glycanilyticus]|uniref:rhodanese-like domain-containing protein n=1 Tax=Paenibacillus glycanilyticus TaxID=126569 RepID=UPI00203A6451|nr:rhodanese-like domain-containing protein [Paenibacillus glycanilyticus]MCM3627731.1 rhodanese-like domain-containing protein [Paenibacillus glycanilyticus]
MGTVTDLTFQQLQAKLNKKGGLKIIDVRTPRSFERGHIKGAINIPYPSWSRTPKVAEEEEVVIVCYVGRRASEQLAKSHDKVFNFKGGMAQWQGEIETETIGSKWSAERIYNLVLGFLLLLSLPLSFLGPWWGTGFSSFIAIGAILFGVTNNNPITRIIRSYGFK